jgi:DNA-binding LacI/PurR family transcriptional regulator
MKHVTIKDMARQLSVSVSTVSRALVDDESISPATRIKIQALAKELGYRRNNYASGLRKGRTNTIGVIVNEMLSPAASKVIEGVQNVMHARGIKVIIANSNDDVEQERSNISLMADSMVDGVIVGLCHWDKNRDDFKDLRNQGVPIVFYCSTPESENITQVSTSDYDNAIKLMEQLHKLGRTRIMHVMGDPSVCSFMEIHRAYRDSLAKFGLKYDPSLVIECSSAVDSGAEIADRIVNDKMDIDAVFACTDIAAIGIMNRLREYNYRIPEDVSIVGFNGSPLSEMVYPKLTTVETPLVEVGERAANLLLERIENPELPACTVNVNTKLLIRGSSHPTYNRVVADSIYTPNVKS